MEDVHFREKGQFVQGPWGREGVWLLEEQQGGPCGWSRVSGGGRDGLGHRLRSDHMGLFRLRGGDEVYSESNGKPWRVCDLKSKAI